MGKNKFRTLGVLLGIALLFSMSNICSALAASFVAQMVMEMKGKKTVSPFYFKDSVYRFDTVQNGVPVYMLIKRKDPFMTMVIPSEKGYMRAPKQMAVLMKNNLFEAHFYASKKFYKLASKSEEKLGNFKCIKEVYTIEGAAGPEKVSIAWVAARFDFPIKIITYHKEKELAKVELRNIEEKQLDPSLFQIPVGYKEIKPSDIKASKRPKTKPAWLKKIKNAPVLTLPFEKVLQEGDIVRVEVPKGHTITFKMESPGPSRDQWAHIEYFAFKKGKKIKNLGEYGGFTTARFKELPAGTDEIVIRVLKRSPRIKAQSELSNIIEAVTIKARTTKMLSSFSFAKAKRPRVIIKDYAGDKVSSFGDISFYRGSKAVLEEKFHLKDGASRSWNVFELGKGISCFVEVKLGKVEVRIEEATAGAPAIAPKQKAPAAARTKTQSKPSPASGPIKLGLWKIQRFVVMPGLPSPVPADNWEMCISEKNVIPLRVLEAPVCKIKDSKIKGSDVVFEFTCQIGEQKSHYRGKVTYSGDSVKGEYTVAIDDGDKVTYKVKGQRLGKCK